MSLADYIHLSPTESLTAQDLRPIFYKLTAKDAVELFLEIDGQRPMTRPWGVWRGFLKHSVKQRGGIIFSWSWIQQ